MLQIRYLWLFTLLIGISCQSPQTESVSDRERFHGGWVVNKSDEVAQEVYVFLPEGEFEGENLKEIDLGSWTISDNFLILSKPNNTGGPIRFEWSFSGEKLVLVEKGNIIELNRRSYGINAQSQLERMARITRSINARLINQREELKDFEEPTGQSRVLGLWTLEDTPVKLAITEPTSGNDFTGFSEFYLIDGYLMYFISPKSSYAFENNVVTSSWNESNELESSEGMSSKGSEILDKLKEYMKLYAITENNGRFRKIEKPEASVSSF